MAWADQVFPDAEGALDLASLNGGPAAGALRLGQWFRSTERGWYRPRCRWFIAWGLLTRSVGVSRGAAWALSGDDTVLPSGVK